MDDGSGVPDGDSEEVETVLMSIWESVKNNRIVVHLWTAYNMVTISVYLVATTTKAHVDLIL